MSHYAVNASVPKTLVQHVIRWVAERGELGAEASGVLREILATEISPELIPRTDGNAGPAPDTESVIGPYELQDFNLYYMLRFGYAPPKVAFLAYCAWRDCREGSWPDVPPDQRRQYDIARIKAVLRHLPRPLLPPEPVQAELHSQRSQGRLRRLAVAPRRLSRSQRQRGDGLAQAARADSGRQLKLGERRSPKLG